jgi:chromosome segregation ATPase
MYELMAKMVVCLLLAALIGFVVAWLLRGLSVQRLSDELSQTAFERERAIKNHSDAEAKLAKSALQITSLQTDLSGLREQATTQTQDWNAALSKLERSHAKDFERFTEAERSLTNDITRLATEKADLSHDLNGLRQAKLDVESERSRLIAEMQTLTAVESGKRQTQDAEMVALRAQLAPLLGLPARQAKEIADLKHEHAQLVSTRAAEVVSLRKAMETKESQFQSQLETERKALAGKDAPVIADLKSQLDRMRNQHSLDLGQKAQQANNLMAELRGQVVALEAEIKNRPNPTATALAELQSAQELARTRDSELSATRRKLGELDVELGRVRAEHNRMVTERDNQLAFNKNHAQALERDLAASVARRKVLEQQLADRAK